MAEKIQNIQRIISIITFVFCRFSILIMNNILSLESQDPINTAQTKDWQNAGDAFFPCMNDRKSK